MRILYFTRADSVHDQRFLTALAESGHEGFVLRLNRGEYPTPSGITALEWSGTKNQLTENDIPRLTQELGEVLKSVQPDLVHAGPLQDLAFLVARTGFTPLLSMSWGFDLKHDVLVSPDAAEKARFALGHSARLITDAQCSAAQAVQLGFDPEKICIFPWGVDLAHFTPTAARVRGTVWRERYGWGDKRVLLCLRSWEPNYGVDVLLRAFVEAAQKDDSLRLILLSDGSQHEELLAILKEGNVNDKVFLGGRVPNQDLISFFGAADIYVTPSHVDGSSVSLMEAMACGLPVIASDIPANAEWIAEGQTGWLFPDGDHHALAELLLQTPSFNLSSVGKRARKVAEKRADWRQNKQLLFRCWEQALTSSKLCPSLNALALRLQKNGKSKMIGTISVL